MILLKEVLDLVKITFTSKTQQRKFLKKLKQLMKDHEEGRMG